MSSALMLSNSLICLCTGKCLMAPCHFMQEGTMDFIAKAVVKVLDAEKDTVCIRYFCSIL